MTRPRPAPPITEAEFTDQVIELLRWHGWLVAHFRPARTAHGWRTPVQGDGAGFPDLIAAHPTRGMFAAELKTRRGRLSRAQLLWLERLEGAGVEIHVWRPDDINHIEARAAGRTDTPAR